jgi:hypothetical protein
VLNLCLRVAPCLLLFSLAAQENIFEKAPPEVDAALRERIAKFYQAHIDGKYRDAYVLVAEDSKDFFLSDTHSTYKSCEIVKITYTENFTKASAVDACKGEYRWHNSKMPVTMPLTSLWKLVDGQWYWYFVPRTEFETPWGISRVTPETSGANSQMPVIPPDPAAAAQQILNQVKLDRSDLELFANQDSKGEVHLISRMPGRITLSADPISMPGLKLKFSQRELDQGQTATIAFEYNPEDASVTCGDCAKKVHPPLTATIHVEPTKQTFPIRISFALAAEPPKPAAKEPSKQSKIKR